MKSTLDHAQKIAEAIKHEQADKLGVSFIVERRSEYILAVDIGQCETLLFAFESVKDIKKEKETQSYSYAYNVLTENGKKELDEGYHIAEYPYNELYYSADFCKTQFADSLVEHIWVAEITRAVAGRCRMALVDDDGDYYHSGKAEDASKAISEIGILINSIGGNLVNAGWEPMQIVKGGETKIKPLR